MDKKIVEYSIAYEIRIRDLNKTVNEMIEKGWQPYGDTIIQHIDPKSNRENDWYFIQPMVKYEEENKGE